MEIEVVHQSDVSVLIHFQIYSPAVPVDEPCMLTTVKSKSLDEKKKSDWGMSANEKLTGNDARRAE